MSRIWFDVITKRDARLLSGWWNRYTCGTFTVERSTTNPRFWRVMRT